MPPAKLRNAYLALIAAAIFWGTSFLFIKNTVESLEGLVGDASYFLTLFIRLFFALISSLVLFFILNFRIVRSELFYFKRLNVYLLALLNIAGYLCQFLGALTTGSAKLALLVNTNVIVVPIVSYFVLQESLNNRKLSGIASGIIGLILITSGGFFSSLLEGELIGGIFSMCSGIFWGFYIVLTRKVLSSSNTPFKPLNLSLTTTILSFLFLIPLIPLYFNSLFSIPAISSGIWAELVYLGIICTTVAYTFYCIGLKSMPAVNATFILLLETVVGVFLGIVFRHELFTLFSIIGAVLIIAAMIIINLS